MVEKTTVGLIQENDVKGNEQKDDRIDNDTGAEREPDSTGGDLFDTAADCEPDSTDRDASDAGSNLFRRWISETIGNCIMYETWLEFQPDGKAIESIVDMNACAGPDAWGVYVTEGEYAVLDGKVLETRFPRNDGSLEIKRQSYAIFKEAIHSHGVGRYHFTDLRLNTFVYHQNPALPGSWERIETDTSIDFELRLTVALSREPEACVPCNMTISWDAKRPVDGSQLKGSITLSAHLTNDAENGRSAIIADGMEESMWTGAWSDKLKEIGFWDNCEAPLCDVVYNAFRPYFFIDLTDDENRGILFHDIYFAWMESVTDYPPANAAEIDCPWCD
jgi:hypothetical protein